MGPLKGRVGQSGTSNGSYIENLRPNHYRPLSLAERCMGPKRVFDYAMDYVYS